MSNYFYPSLKLTHHTSGPVRKVIKSIGEKMFIKARFEPAILAFHANAITKPSKSPQLRHINPLIHVETQHLYVKIEHFSLIDIQFQFATRCYIYLKNLSSGFTVVKFVITCYLSEKCNFLQTVPSLV